MGNTFQPKTEITTVTNVFGQAIASQAIASQAIASQADHSIQVSASSMQGYRKEMEDTHIMAPLSEDHFIFGVFDGHGGVGAAECVERDFVHVLKDSSEWFTYMASQSLTHLKIALTNCFARLDDDLRSFESIGNSGCTATVVIITPLYIICANAGDSRAVMSSSQNTTIALSHDHKPQNPDEMARIEKHGGTVYNDRVNGNLAVSRGFGDFELKPMVSSEPEFEIHLRKEFEDEFVIIACDGLWDVFSNEDATMEVRKIIQEGETNVSLISEEMVEQAFLRGSTDNISAIVVLLQPIVLTNIRGGGVMVRRQKREEETQLRRKKEEQIEEEVRKQNEREQKNS
jgi:serine/threonine protein phosphatase PrpC